jgi:hypothetical protein
MGEYFSWKEKIMSMSLMELRTLIPGKKLERSDKVTKSRGIWIEDDHEEVYRIKKSNGTFWIIFLNGKNQNRDPVIKKFGDPKDATECFDGYLARWSHLD